MACAEVCIGRLQIRDGQWNVEVRFAPLRVCLCFRWLFRRWEAITDSDASQRRL